MQGFCISVYKLCDIFLIWFIRRVYRRLALETEEALKEQDKRLSEILGKHQVRYVNTITTFEEVVIFF